MGSEKREENLKSYAEQQKADVRPANAENTINEEIYVRQTCVVNSKGYSDSLHEQRVLSKDVSTTTQLNDNFLSQLLAVTDGKLHQREEAIVSYLGSVIGAIKEDFNECRSRMTLLENSLTESVSENIVCRKRISQLEERVIRTEDDVENLLNNYETIKQANVVLISKCDKLEDIISANVIRSEKNFKEIVSAIKEISCKDSTKIEEEEAKISEEKRVRNRDNNLSDIKKYGSSPKVNRNSKWLEKLNPSEVLEFVKQGKVPTVKRFKFIYLGGFPDSFFINKRLWCKWLGLKLSDIVFVRSCYDGVRELFVNEHVAKKIIEACITNFEGVYWIDSRKEAMKYMRGQAECSLKDAMELVMRNWKKMVHVYKAARVINESLSADSERDLCKFTFSKENIETESICDGVKRVKEETLPPGSKF